MRKWFGKQVEKMGANSNSESKVESTLEKKNGGRRAKLAGVCAAGALMVLAGYGLLRQGAPVNSLQNWEPQISTEETKVSKSGKQILSAIKDNAKELEKGLQDANIPYEKLAGSSFSVDAKSYNAYKKKIAKHGGESADVFDESKISVGEDMPFLLMEQNEEDEIQTVVDNDIDLSQTLKKGQRWKDLAEQQDKTLVAVIDSGVNGYAVHNENFTDEKTGRDTINHGTLVGSLIHEESDGDAMILGLKAFNDDGIGYMSDVLEAIDYAREQQVDIINLSFTTDKTKDTDVFEQAVRDCVADGITVVASAGNFNQDIKYYVPASVDGVLSVGALDSTGNKHISSNYGDVDYYVESPSTSQAAAIVSGMLARKADMSDVKTGEDITVQEEDKTEYRPIFGDEEKGQFVTQAANQNVVISSSGRGQVLVSGLTASSVNGAQWFGDGTYNLGYYANGGVWNYALTYYECRGIGEYQATKVTASGTGVYNGAQYIPNRDGVLSYGTIFYPANGKTCTLKVTTSLKTYKANFNANGGSLWGVKEINKSAGSQLLLENNRRTFNGTSTYHSLGNNNFSYGNKVSIAGRFQHTEVPINVNTNIISNVEAAGARLYTSKDAAGGKIAFQIHVNGKYQAVYGPRVTANTIYWAAGTYDGSTMRLYINGSLYASKAVSGNITVSGEPYLIGANPNKNNASRSEFFKGNIYKAGVYREVLSASDVQKMAQTNEFSSISPRPVVYHNWAIETPTRSGYTFDGWYTAASGGSKISGSTTMPSGGATYYAHWRQNTGHLDVNGVVDGTQIWSGLPAKFDVYVNGVKVGTDVSDFGYDVPIGQKWEIKNVRPNSGYKSTHGTASGTMTASGSSPNLYFQKENYISYDLQGGSINKNISNPNGYKIVDNGYYTINSVINTNKYIHISNMSLANSSPIVIYDGSGGSAYQTVWYFERYQDTPYYYIINKYSGKALNLYGDINYVTNTSAIEQYDQLDGGVDSDFLWYLKDQGNGYVSILNKKTGYAIDLPNQNVTNGTVLQQFESNNTNAQKFRLNAVETGQYPRKRKVVTGRFVVNSSVPVKPGYTFKGWNTRANGIGDWFQPGQELKTDVTVTLYAQWTPNTYTVTYKANGGTGSDQTQTVTYGTSWTTKGAIFSKTGYTLESWNTQADGKGKSYGLSANVDGISENVTLYAQWTPNTYKIHYDGNGNTVKYPGDVAQMKDSSHTYDVAKKLSKNEYTRIGWDFVGWNTAKDGSGKAYKDEESVKNLTATHNGTVTLYAQWEPKGFMVVFHPNGGTTPQPFSEKEGEQGQPIGELPTTTRKGYTFLGWYDTETLTENSAQATENTVLLIKLTELWAQWEKETYSISYDYNGGTVQDNPESYSVDTPTITLKNPTRAGYLFTGWTGSNGDTPQTTVTIPKGSTGDQSYVANWKPITYTIRYNGNGATSGTMSDSSHTYDVAKALTQNKYVRKNAKFIGWNTKADGSGTSYDDMQSVDNLTTQNGAVIPLYAQWEKTKVVVHFDSQGGSKVADINGYAGDPIGELAIPTREGYTFDGWWTHPGTGSPISETTPLPADETTYYAHWIANGYTITYDLDGGKVSGNPNTYKPTDKDITLKNPTKVGYDFVGWVGTDISSPSQTVVIKTGSMGNRRYEAIWKAHTYTIAYHGNGSTSGSMSSSRHTYDVAKNLTKNGFNRTGYDFVGWNTKADGRGVAYKNSQSVKNLTSTNGATVTLYAQWKIKQYKVTFDPNMDASSNTVTIYAGTREETLKRPNGSTYREQTGGTKTKYILTFHEADPVKGLLSVRIKGLFPAFDGSIRKVESTKTSIVDFDPTTITKVVKFDANGGTCDIESARFTINTSLATLPVPVREGYKFDGWYTEPDGGTKVTTSTPLGNKDMTLYAHWTAKTYTITYRGNNGVMDDGNDSFKEEAVWGSNYAISSNPFVREGYTFKGWNTKSDGSGKDYTHRIDKEEEWKEDRDVILYAIWKK